MLGQLHKGTLPEMEGRAGTDPAEPEKLHEQFNPDLETWGSG